MIARTRAKDNSMVTPSMSSKILPLKRKLVLSKKYLECLGYLRWD